jgi:4-amino-4-deoxy-L-arabinose transferase-like glycosyltransferase
MFKQRNTLLLLFFGIIFFCFIRVILSFDGLYGQDAYEYLRYTESLQNYFTTGKNPGDYFWGVYYPLIGSFLTFIIGNSALALQLLSFFSLFVSSVYLHKIIELIYKEKNSIIVVFVFFSLSPILLIHSFLIMSDMLTCALVLSCMYYFLSYLESSKKSAFIFGVAFCLLAILTRFAVVVILFPICIAVLWKLLQRKQYKLILYSIPIILVISLPHVAFKSQNSLQFLSHHWLQNWNILNLFKSDFITIEGPRSNHFINLFYIFFTFFHPVFFVFGPFIIILFLKNEIRRLTHYQILILISVILFSLFIGGIPYQNKRYLIPAFAFLFILIFPTFRYIQKFRFFKILLSVVFVIQMVLIFYFGKQYYDRNLLEKKIVAEMKPYQNKTLYVFDIDVAMQGRGLQFRYKNLFLERYVKFENEALVLINEKQITQQWNGKNPLINWENIQKKCVLVKLKTSDKNWSLYKISALK